jgi:hypothetical protein
LPALYRIPVDADAFNITTVPTSGWIWISTLGKILATPTFSEADTGNCGNVAPPGNQTHLLPLIA